MAVDYTTAQMIANVKRKVVAPETQSLFTNDEIVEFLDDELQSVVVPQILSVREDYFVVFRDMTPDTRTTLERDDFLVYNIGGRAIGSAVYDVIWISEDGQEVNVPRFTHSESVDARQSRRARIHFVMLNNYIYFYHPQGGTNHTLRVFIHERPSHLVSTSKAGLISNVNTTTNQVTVSNTAPDWAVNTVLDYIGSTPPFTMLDRGWQKDYTITAINGFVVTLASVDGLGENNYLATENTSPIAMIPEEGHRLLEQSAVVQILAAIDDQTALKVAHQKYEMMREAFFKVINPRVRHEIKKVSTNKGLFSYMGR